MHVYDFDPGDFVIHPSHKDCIGQVQSIVDNKVTVNFQNVEKNYKYLRNYFGKYEE